MIITYHGDNYFRLQAGNTIVLVDPTNQRSFKGAALVLNTIKPADTEPPENNEPFWIDYAGEYEIQNVKVRGFNAGFEDDKKKTVYLINFDETNVAILGHISREPNAEIQEHLKNADCLIVPASGKPWLPIPTAAKLVRQLEPSIIIPSLYGSNLKIFLKEFNGESQPEEKLVFKKKDLKPNAMMIKCLKA